MSAREELLAALHAGDVWDRPGVPERLVDAFAHELAEKQRERASSYALMRSETMRLRAAGAREVADLIDPEVST